MQAPANMESANTLKNTPAGVPTNIAVLAAPGAGLRVRLWGYQVWTTNLPGFPPGITAWVWFTSGTGVVVGGGGIQNTGAAYPGVVFIPGGLPLPENEGVSVQVLPAAASQHRGLVFYTIESV